MKKIFSCLLFIFASILATPILACSIYIPSPEPNETPIDYDIRLAKYREEEQKKSQEIIKTNQKNAWENSNVIAIATIDNIKKINIKNYGSSNKVRLKITRLVKGSSKTKHVWLQYTEITGCGPVGGGDAVRGKLGDVFVIFSESPRISSKSVTDTIGKSSALDDNIKSLFAPNS